MSRENLLGFYMFLAKNSAGMTKVKNFRGNVDAVLAYAREQGYDFSPEELQAQRNIMLQYIKGRIQEIRQLGVSSTPHVQAFRKLFKLDESDEEVSKRLSELLDQLIAHSMISDIS